MTEPLLTKREAADWLRCSEDTVERAVRSGALPCVRLGAARRLVRFRREDLDHYVARLASTPAPAPAAAGRSRARRLTDTGQVYEVRPVPGPRRNRNRTRRAS